MVMQMAVTVVWRRRRREMIVAFDQ